MCQGLCLRPYNTRSIEVFSSQQKINISNLPPTHEHENLILKNCDNFQGRK
jgi:hypothetical protein